MLALFSSSYSSGYRIFPVSTPLIGFVKVLSASLCHPSSPPQVLSSLLCNLDRHLSLLLETLPLCARNTPLPWFTLSSLVPTLGPLLMLLGPILNYSQDILDGRLSSLSRFSHHLHVESPSPGSSWFWTCMVIWLLHILPACAPGYLNSKQVLGDPHLPQILLGTLCQEKARLWHRSDPRSCHQHLLHFHVDAFSILCFLSFSLLASTNPLTAAGPPSTGFPTPLLPGCQRGPGDSKSAHVSRCSEVLGPPF